MYLMKMKKADLGNLEVEEKEDGEEEEEEGEVDLADLEIEEGIVVLLKCNEHCF
jgi:hypothetical protein